MTRNDIAQNLHNVLNLPGWSQHTTIYNEAIWHKSHAMLSLAVYTNTLTLRLFYRGRSLYYLTQEYDWNDQLMFQKIENYIKDLPKDLVK